MTIDSFDYKEYEIIREKLVKTIHANLTDEDKGFLLGVKNVVPDWNIYDFERFPAIRWKLQNLKNLKEKNPDKHRELYNVLGNKLNLN